MNVDCIIIGQGVCGSFLSYYLEKEGKRFVVIDDNDPNSSSKIAAGVINPVTGRRLVTVWLADRVIHFAWKAYQEIGLELGVTSISHKNVIDFFPNPFMREGFLDKIATGDVYVHSFPEQNHFNEWFNYEFGCGEIRPVYMAHLEALLPAWRSHLIETNSLLEMRFDIRKLQVEKDRVHYEDIIAEKIIFCDGTNSFQNPYFQLLPFAPNKGEALVVEIPGLPDHHIYKKSMMLVPMLERDQFWVGASYVWDFPDADPSKEFRERTEAVLKEWVKLPFKVLEHRSGLRPATLERRPFVGFHPLHPSVGILNGMGTKGCSLGPYFAKQLCDHYVHGTEIAKDGDVGRFRKILSRAT